MGQIGEQLFQEMYEYTTGLAAVSHPSALGSAQTLHGLPVYGYRDAPFYSAWSTYHQPLSAMEHMATQVPAAAEALDLKPISDSTDMSVDFTPTHYVELLNGEIIHPAEPATTRWRVADRRFPGSSTLYAHQGGNCTLSYTPHPDHPYGNRYAPATVQRGLFSLIEQFDERFPEEATAVLRGLQTLRQAHYQGL